MNENLYKCLERKIVWGDMCIEKYTFTGDSVINLKTPEIKYNTLENDRLKLDRYDR